MTPEQLQLATGCTAANANKYAGPLTAAMAKYGIKTANQVAGFIGNVAHECGLFTVTGENLNYSSNRLTQVWPARFPTIESTAGYAMNPAALAEKVYGMRATLGNNSPGDGAKFKGRGLIQLTGRFNYERYAKASGFDVVSHPERLLDTDYAADSAAWFFTSTGCINLAQVENWPALTRKINGGMTGHAERMVLINRCRKALG